MDPLQVIAYFILLTIGICLEGWFVHRKIENEWDRWTIFILLILIINSIVAAFRPGEWGLLIIITGAFLLGITVNRILQNLIRQRGKNQELTNQLIQQVEDTFSRRGIE